MTFQANCFSNESSGNLNDSDSESDFQARNLWQLKLTAYFIIFVISLAGNSLVIAVHMHSPGTVMVLTQ